MKYVVPFSFVRQRFVDLGRAGKAAGGNHAGGLSEEMLIELAKLFLMSVDVDEAWYRKTNPDVDEAIIDGVQKSAKEHFVQSGYFEDRLPAELTVDETWYLSQYPDVQQVLKEGIIKSPTQHFHEHGYREGRRPFRN